MRTARSLLFVALIAMAASLLSSCDEGSEITPPAPVDTTAPLVVSVSPSMNETDVSSTASVTVTFSEDMDPSAAEGNVTLSSGAITNMTWSDPRTLVIDHEPWAQGVEVTVTLGSGLVDTAANALEAAFTLRFWTQSADIQLLTTEPDDGQNEALLNTIVSLLFSHEMDLVSLTAATSVTSGSQSVAFELDDGDETWVLMSFEQTLPASSTIDVTISTAAQAIGGGNLATATSFSFDTGDEVDDTPPSLVGVEPANGSTVAPGSHIRFSFDEPIDTDAFSPAVMGAQMWVLTDDDEGQEPVWSEGGTVLTLALPADLPPGLPLFFSFDSYQDRAGNVQTTDIVYELTLSGVADFYPFTDGFALGYEEFLEEGMNEATTSERWESSWRRLEADTGDRYRVAEYGDDTFGEARGWDYMRPIATGVEFIGFHDEGDVFFDVAVPYVRLPWHPQTWSGTLTATSGEGSMSGTYTVQVIVQEDVDFFVPEGEAGTGESDPDLVWKDCWKWAFTFDLMMGNDHITGTWTAWFAPGVGIVRMIRAEEEADGSWESRDMHLTQVRQ